MGDVATIEIIGRKTTIKEVSILTYICSVTSSTT